MGSSFGVAEDHFLNQGDVLLDYRLVFPDELVRDQQAEAEATPVLCNLIVLSPTCELVHEKLTRILTAPIYLEHEVATHPQAALLRSSTRLGLIREGFVPAMCMLGGCELDFLTSPWFLVDFRGFAQVSATHARQHAAERSVRPRLCPPFREYLSQALARFFMRIAVPDEHRVQIDRTDSKGKVHAIEFLASLAPDERREFCKGFD